MKTIALVACLLLAACNTPTPPPPDAAPPPAPAQDSAPIRPDAAPATCAGDCACACAVLTAASCPMGADPSCVALLQTMNDEAKQPNPANGNRPLTCADVLKVKTKADAVKLGFVCQ